MEDMNEAQRLVNMERERRRAAGEPLLTEYEVERIMSRVPRGDGPQSAPQQAGGD
jgi:hypothetical protein